MRILAAVLVAFFLLLQYRLWIGEGSLREVARLRAEIAQQQGENEGLRERNRMLAAEVQDLKEGTTAIEERARTDLGMIGSGETFYQVVAPKAPAAPQESSEGLPGQQPGEGVEYRDPAWRTAQGAQGAQGAAANGIRSKR